MRRVDHFPRFSWILVVLVLLSPLFVYWPNHPYPQISGPVMYVRMWTVALALMCVLERPRELLHLRSPLSISLAVFAGALAIATMASVDRTLSLWSTADRLTGAVDQLLWVLLALLLSIAVQDWRRVVAWATVVGAVLAWGGMLDAMVFGEARPVSLTGNTGFLAVYMVGTLLSSLFLAGRKGPHRLFWIGTAGAAALVLDLSGTRAAIVAGFAGMAVLATLGPPGLTRVASIVLALWLGFVLLVGPSLDRVQTVIDTVTGDPQADAAIVHRVSLTQTALSAALQRPLTGYGPNTYGIVHQELAPADSAYADYPHNMAVEELVSKGLLSLPSFALVGLVGWTLWRRRRRDPLAVLFLAILAGLAVYGLFWFLSWPMALWCVLIGGYAVA